MFQSTRPVRGATIHLKLTRKYEIVSIHAPRAGRDFMLCKPSAFITEFQSTRPVRGATF